jgi:PPE-repeat protein
MIVHVKDVPNCCRCFKAQFMMHYNYNITVIIIISYTFKDDRQVDDGSSLNVLSGEQKLGGQVGFARAGSNNAPAARHSAGGRDDSTP